MIQAIPYARQSISEEDISEVVRVLRSDFLTQGPAIESFEKSVSEYCKAKEAIALTSATAALHLACMALNVSRDSIVWTSAITFVASANCALYCGAKVDFIDIDSKTFNISVEKLEEKLISAEKSGNLPAVVIAVHFGGQSCDMKRIHSLSKEYGFRIIEDASHAIGGSYLNQKIGNCQFSDLTVFSFHPVKIITTGEGGMIVTDDAAIADRIRLLRSHGITRDVRQMKNESDGPWYYEQIELGYNYRITDIQAALGQSQLKRIGQFVDKRNLLAKRYAELLAELPVQTQEVREDSRSSYHLYVIRLNRSEIHKRVFESLRSSGVLVNLHYIPVYLQPYYKGLGFKSGHCPEAEKYYSEAISMPMYADLTFEQQDTVKESLVHALSL